LVLDKKLRKLTNILVTGGSGFIGSNFIRYTFRETSFKGTVVNLDNLTYAGNNDNLKDVGKDFKDRYCFELGNICDRDKVNTILEKYEIDTIINFAAESHVDKSIIQAEEFVKTNVLGTFILLDAAMRYWQGRDDTLFHHISTDEVYGSLPETGYFYETTPYSPRSPYAASKAASDHFADSFFHTHSLPVTVSNCSNNYGPYQYLEKFMPLMITNILEEKALPIYGDGRNVRDWLFVDDHSSALWLILNKGRLGEKYNIGGENEWENLQLVNLLCEKVAIAVGKDKNYYKKLITFVKDRLGHDRRYAINCDKIKNELGWRQKVLFEKGIERTIKWYISES